MSNKEQKGDDYDGCKDKRQALCNTESQGQQGGAQGLVATGGDDSLFVCIVHDWLLLLKVYDRDRLND